MDGLRVRDGAAAVAACAGVLLLADLALGWYSVSVSVAMTAVVEATASGWSGIGVVAGLLTIAMLVYMIRPLRHAGTVDVLQAAVTAVLGVAVLGFAVAAAATGSASVVVPAAAVEVGTWLWPVYVGIGLAAVVAGGTLVALVEVLAGATAPARVLERAGR